MNTQEVTQLLARISVLDNRKVDAFTIEAWEPLLYDVDYDDAVRAVQRHFRESEKYLHPVHIVNYSRVYAAVRREQARTVKHAPTYDANDTCTTCGINGEWRHRMLFCEHAHPQPGVPCAKCEKPYPERSYTGNVIALRDHPLSLEDAVTLRLRGRGA